MCAYAVIKTGGKQYRVAKGDEVRFERLDGEVGETIDFEEVLLTSDGETIEVGRPFVENSKVVGRITHHGKGKKVMIFKYKRRKDYRRKKGHRQQFTLVRIEDIKGAHAEASGQEVQNNGT
ncbi:MAG: 50S ribosomal protein L21 [Deltaproteobacteria bacterium]|nr:50S ribosomal protein L21 [Deltaproteobacteria bacterium]